MPDRPYAELPDGAVVVTDDVGNRHRSGRPTMRDVAARAGVSLMTVSRVINDFHDVGETTRIRVHKAMALLQYEPSEAAKALAGVSEVRLTMLYAAPGFGILADLLTKSMDEARRRDVHMGFQRCAWGGDHSRLPNRLRQAKSNGVVLLPPLGDDLDLLAVLSEADIPTVSIGSLRSRRNVRAICMDDRQAAFDMAEHLFMLGHRRMGFVTGHHRQTASIERLAGFRDAVERFGLDHDAELVAQGDFTYASGLNAAEQLLSLPLRPTAILASNDDMAAAVITTAQSRNPSVSSDLAVCGFDDTFHTATLGPKITTIRQPIEDMARRAIEMLCDHARAKRSINQQTSKTLVGYEIVRRQSDAAP